MSIWLSFEKAEREEYIRFLQIYGALSNLFRQKQGEPIPYLDSKFQETIFARIFHSENVDKGNTPHDILSIVNNQRVGIGLKTWMNSKASFQKVMQLKSYQNEINGYKNSYSLNDVVRRISEIKNERMRQDYARLGLSQDLNIYHYVTRDKGKFTINECSYPLVDIDNIRSVKENGNSLFWEDGIKKYKYTFGDSQVWQYFDPENKFTHQLEQFEVKIIEDPFEFLTESYQSLIGMKKEQDDEIVEVFLPLYSYRDKEVGEKSGLNAWNAAPKNKNSSALRPLNEVYIPIPREFHHKYPDFFTKDIFEAERIREQFKGTKQERPEVRFYLQLPNGKRIPALVTQDNMKGLQSGSNTEKDENGRYYGQSALGEWLLVQVLGLSERTPVTREWLKKKDTDSVRLWRKKGDYSIIYIDFAPFGAFEKFMGNDDSGEISL